MVSPYIEEAPIAFYHQRTECNNLQQLSGMIIIIQTLHDKRDLSSNFYVLQGQGFRISPMRNPSYYDPKYSKYGRPKSMTILRNPSYYDPKYSKYGRPKSMTILCKHISVRLFSSVSLFLLDTPKMSTSRCAHFGCITQK